MTFLKRRWLMLFFLALLVVGSLIYSRWSTRTLSVHIGKPYELVVKDSSFPVEDKTAIYPGDPDDPEDPPRPGSTWISSPTVIDFDDPAHGFKLPPTVFGAITYANKKVSTLTTSPMSETLPFTQALDRLVTVQDTLKSRGWKVEPLDNNDWFIVDSADERERLRAKLFDQAVGIDLYVPGQYSLLLLIKCYARCDKGEPEAAKYLIDISVGRDRSGA
ncbi:MULTISPECIES: hypothetical protein [unclassified Pseudomonas]|uniref:hypothetical protein n=1 Tax=unclassified Pseudomonas TaxID=196821 RepID=UPI0021151D8B|nr:MULTISPECIES: hypothetical protein [unclassified Pseudomonas]